MTADDSHAALAATWEGLSDTMDCLAGELQWGGPQYLEITNMADRVRGLGSHLNGAIELANSLRYESALALLRTALEQCVVDWLVFRGKVLIQNIKGVEEETWQGWQFARAAGADWTETIKDWTRTRRGDVRIVREGLKSEPDADGNRRLISIYYFLLEQYEPNMGPPSVQIDEWSITKDELRRMAQENQDLWHTYLTWSSLVKNLGENDLLDEVDCGRLNSHYRFLSGHAHPVVDHRRAIYGRNAFQWPKYDHYSSELILLYVIAFAVLELDNFIRSLDDIPDVAIRNVDQVADLLERSRSAISYFWFLGTHPHAYDIWKTRNEVAFRAIRNRATGAAAAQAVPEPEKIPYPSNPLTRLIALHGSARELMTGLAYVSPWPRNDARFR